VQKFILSGIILPSFFWAAPLHAVPHDLAHSGKMIRISGQKISPVSLALKKPQAPQKTAQEIPAQDFQKWVRKLKTQAALQGISEKTLQKALKNVKFNPRVIELDRRQPEKTMSLSEYVHKVVNSRLKKANRFFKENHSLLGRISTQYGVQPEFIIALWGVESLFGQHMGKFSVIDSLASLAYEGRRAEFFTRELISLLKIMDRTNLSPRYFKGSWAGAMGQCQFMPSSYRAYAVDIDQDGRRDLWQSLEDALASVANYLHEHRWQTGQPVVLPATVVDESKLPKKPKLKLDYTLGELAELGVTPLYGDLPPDTKAMLVKLEREDGYEYWIGLNNFYAITRYNRSPLYAMAVFQLSQAIVDATPAGPQAKQYAQHSAGEAK